MGPVQKGEHRFDEAKKIAWDCLDACTADIIQWFFN
jgi:hypothetical protein